jgi:hypothetical protein
MSGREVTRTVLRYDLNLTQDNSWRLLGSKDGIAVRVRIGSLNHSGEVLLRWKALPSAEKVFVAPADSNLTLWITQPCVVAEGLLPMELQLEWAPQEAIDTMEDW